MIVLAPQLEDWDELSANQTIALTKYFLEHYNIDRNKVYISGYSGGETLSWVLTKEPKLYSAALMCFSKWDGYLIDKKDCNRFKFVIICSSSL